MRRAAKVDENQTEIVEALRKAGRQVLISSQIGKGFPDIIVGYNGKNFLLEIKIEKGKLTPDQEKFFQAWRGQVAIVRTVEEALALTSL